MATLTVGDTGTGSNNVTGVVADYGSIASAHTAASASDTIQLIQNAELSGGSALTISKAVTITAHADCAVNAPTYAALTGRARTSKTITVTATSGTIEKIGFDTGSSQAVKFSASSGSWLLRRCVLRSSYNGIVEVATVASALDLTVSNCAMMNTGSGVGFYITSGSTMTLYHCSAATPASHWSTYYSEGTMVCYACVAQGGSATVGQFDSTGVSGDYNVSQDTSAPGSSSTKYYRSTSSWFANTGSTTEDLALATAAKGKWVADGKDAIADYSAQDCATDIVGTSRAAPIDPGVWQTPAAAATTYPWRLLLLGVG